MKLSEMKKPSDIFKIFKRDDKKGVEKEDVDETRNLKNFFGFFGRKFTKLLSLNLYYVPLLLIALAAFAVVVWGPYIKAPSSKLFPALYGVMTIDPSPSSQLFYGIYGTIIKLPIYTIPMILGLIGIAILFIVAFAAINIGTSYILRSIIRGEPIFMWSDFWYAIKKNLKQGLLIGILDAILIGVLCFDFYYFHNASGSIFIDMMYFAIIFIMIIYFFMRFYLYIITITFDLKTIKVFKNSLIFSILGFKRNIMAVLGIAALVGINFVLVLIFLPMNIILPLILPLVYLPACGSFIAMYAAYPKVKELMIDPYYDENGNKNGAESASL